MLRSGLALASSKCVCRYSTPPSNAPAGTALTAALPAKPTAPFTACLPICLAKPLKPTISGACSAALRIKGFNLFKLQAFSAAFLNPFLAIASISSAGSLLRA